MDQELLKQLADLMAENGRLTLDVETFKSQRDKLLSQYEGLSLSVASALDWSADGKPFDVCIRELKTERDAYAKAAQNFAVICGTLRAQIKELGIEPRS